jgi:acyl-CoA synthetase (AMP-forming)/AMP-acid ligase II/1-acyl-sn-glycerol-3-phosphate acyltransferase/acyl carrier protein
VLNFFHELILYFLAYFGRFLFSLRYWVKVRGLKGLKKYRFYPNKGTIFLASHPAEVDPPLLFCYLWPRYKIRFVASDFVMHTPYVRNMMKLVNVIPIPAFDQTSNSFKRRASEKAMEACVKALNRGENICIYPAGGLKRTPQEVIAGTSGIHEILQKVPEANVVLIRTTGLWGSMFSTALTGKSPELLDIYFSSLKVLWKNFLFFAPRRKVLIEIEPAAPDFPKRGERKILNEYLENWFNKHGPEPITLVSYSAFKEQLPHITKPPKEKPADLESIPIEIQEHVIDEVAKFMNLPKESLTPEMDFALDMGMDSLDRAQLALILKDQFGVENVPSRELTTLQSMMAYAAQVKTAKAPPENQQKKKESKWEEEHDRPLPSIPLEGETLVEMFLRTSVSMSNRLAAADEITGELTYQKMRLAVVVMAEHIRSLPGTHIGILLPASVGVNILIFATQLAGKVPVMINWTLGERNLETIVEKTGIEVTISSWKFLDRLSNTELGVLNDQIMTIEDIRYSISIFSKLKGLLFSYLPVSLLMRRFGVQKMNENDPAVVLFTSGTESKPKGVPLTHQNLIANLRGGMPVFKFQPNDVLIGVLPPFHSFGFSVTGMFPLISGLRVAYTPNPTNGRQIARAIERWKGTMFCSAPTFLKNVLKVAKKKQLKSLRYVVAGAEKTGDEVFEKFAEMCPDAELLEGYGITECSPILCANPPGLPTKGVGRPIENVEIKIVDTNTHRELPRGERGLIIARGPNIFKGYLGYESSNPFLRFNGLQWYNTGDLGRFDERGYLTIEGRLKRFVKIGGEMISLPAVEEVLIVEGNKLGWKIDSEVPSLAVIEKEEGDKPTLHLFTTFPLQLTEANQVLKEKGFSNLIKLTTCTNLFTLPLLGTGKIDYKELKNKLP